MGASKVGDLFILAQLCEELSGAETDGGFMLFLLPFFCTFPLLLAIFPPPLRLPLCQIALRFPQIFPFSALFSYACSPSSPLFPAVSLFDSLAASC